MNRSQPDPRHHTGKIKQLTIALVSAGLSHLGEQEASHSRLVRRLVEGAVDTFNELGLDVEVQLLQVECPGVLEIPLMIDKLISDHDIDGALGAALIVNGGIYRHEFVAQSSLDALMQVSISRGVPVASSFLTPVEMNSPKTQYDMLHDNLYLKGQEGAEALLRQILQLQAIKNSSD